MTKLLVSVRNAEEACAAVAGGADLIDIKEPAAGALGAANETTIRSICDQVHFDVPLSAACGELTHAAQFPYERLPARLSFAKIGLHQCSTLANWKELLDATWGRIPAGIARVAVCYADHEISESPMPSAIVEAARNGNCRFMLFDTFDKSAGNLLRVLPDEKIDSMIADARAAGLGIVLAGSLDVHSIPTVVRRWRPDIVAVRGAACEQGRNGMVSVLRVAQLKKTIQLAARSPHDPLFNGETRSAPKSGAALAKTSGKDDFGKRTR